MQNIQSQAFTVTFLKGKWGT